MCFIEIRTGSNHFFSIVSLSSCSIVYIVYDHCSYIVGLSQPPFTWKCSDKKKERQERGEKIGEIWRGEGQNYSYYLDTFIFYGKSFKNGDKKKEKRGKKGGIGGKQRRIEKRVCFTHTACVFQSFYWQNLMCHQPHYDLKIKENILF